MNSPRILVFDIETAPMELYGWGLRDQNFSLSQIKEDWSILAWAAKWLGDPPSKTMYFDNRDKKNVRDDKKLTARLTALLNQADVVITQNGIHFDSRKVNARASFHKLRPVRPYKHIDIYLEERKVFAHTSNKLEYKSQYNETYKKLKHAKFPDFELWKEVLKGNKEAWISMKEYSIHDVLSTEERYLAIRGWINTVNAQLYVDDNSTSTSLQCPKCGSKGTLTRDGYTVLTSGRYQMYQDTGACGGWSRGAKNLLSVEQRKNTLRNVR